MSRARPRAWPLLLLLLLLIGASAMADKFATTAPPGSWVIDPHRSTALVDVHLRLRKPLVGRMTGVSGTLQGSPGAGWQIAVAVDARSLGFGGPRWIDRTTRSDAFLAVERHPTISFRSDVFNDAMLRAGGPLAGSLGLRGLTQPVGFRLLPFACGRPEAGCEIRVEGTISRHEFGMTAQRTIVKDAVDFRIRVLLQPVAP